MTRQSFLSGCRTVHSWLGIVVFPWVIAIGLTGVYLNHSKAIYPLITQATFSESRFEQQPADAWGSREQAQVLAETVWPGQPTTEIWEEPYHGRPGIYVENPEGLTVLSIRTGHYYKKTRYRRLTYAPDGELLHTKYYWGAVFNDLHRSGWLGWGLGTWIADAVGLLLTVFGLTGVIMWTVPKVRKLRAWTGR
jgi:hypothetical protein